MKVGYVGRILDKYFNNKLLLKIKLYLIVIVLLYKIRSHNLFSKHILM